VKARAKLDDAAEAVLPRQKRRIIAAAEAWLAAHPEHAGYDLRFDAVLVAPGKLPQHIVSAFEVES
jgi:putative endonuclease